MYENIAHMSIQDRRSKLPVPLPPYGTLHDYVPFYFAPRQPMLYSIYKGRVEGYHNGQDHIIYLVSCTENIHNSGATYVFTDGHAIMAFTNFYRDLKDLDKIDWAVMKARYWKDTDEDPDRSRRRQAEFLVHQFVSMDLFLGIAVKNQEIKQKVEDIIHKWDYNIPVVIRDWYF